MNWSTFLSTFGLVFLAELGDKTQLAVVTQTCKFRSPWAVFAGSSLALTAVTALGAVGGRLLNTFLPPDVIRIVASAAFIVMGVLIFRESRKSEEDAACAYDDAAMVCVSGWDWKAFSATFSLLFLAELGDKTQLAVLGLASKQPTPWITLGGGALALTAVTALGVVGGQQLCKWVPQQLLLKVSAVAFVVMGVLMGVGIF